jgi:hypothetical protein
MLLGNPFLHGRLQYCPSLGLFYSGATFAHMIQMQVCWLRADGETVLLLHTEQNGLT